MSESGYYAWKDRPDAPRTLRRIWLAGEIADADQALMDRYAAGGAMAVARAAYVPGGLSVEELAAGWERIVTGARARQHGTAA